MSVACFGMASLRSTESLADKNSLLRQSGSKPNKKWRCNEAPGISQAVLETLGRVGSIQAQEVRVLLEKKLGMINQRACGLINQTITKTLTDSRMSLEVMDVGHGTRGASGGEREVSVAQYHCWTTDTEQATRSCSLAVFSWEMGYQRQSTRILFCGSSSESLG